MVYYGSTLDTEETDQDTGALYRFLKNALLTFPDHMPLRGAQHFQEGNWQYTCSTEGTFNSFSGKETFLHLGKEVYRASFTGGLVDQK